jgi:hypothetical protein
MDNIAADFSNARNDIVSGAQGAPPSGSELAKCRQKAVERADRFLASLPIQATRSGWSTDEIEEHKANLVEGLVSDRRNSHDGTGEAYVIQAAIERLIAKPTS